MRDLSEIANRLKREMDCSQQKMADRLGVAQPTVAQALDGQTRQLETLRRIALELGYELEGPLYRLRPTDNK
jgi:transcriptional regulator with XRE-family HTH domain